MRTTEGPDAQRPAPLHVPGSGRHERPTGRLPSEGVAELAAQAEGVAVGVEHYSDVVLGLVLREGGACLEGARDRLVEVVYVYV